MPVTLNATAGAASANTYLALADFDARAEVAGMVAGAYGEDARKRALVNATARIDRERFLGAVTSPTQRLEWPRTGVPVARRAGQTYAADAIPEPVLEATTALALAILAGFNLAPVDRFAGLKRLRVEGATDMEFRDGAALAADDLRRLPGVFGWLEPLLAVLDTDGDGVADASPAARAVSRSTGARFAW